MEALVDEQPGDDPGGVGGLGGPGVEVVEQAGGQELAEQLPLRGRPGGGALGAGEDHRYTPGRPRAPLAYAQPAFPAGLSNNHCIELKCH